MFTLPFSLFTKTAIAVILSDPYWENVVLYAPYDADTTDLRYGIVGTNSSVAIDAAGKFSNGLKFTSTSSSSVKYPASANYAFGTGDWTIDGWITYATTPSNAYLFDIGSNGFYLQYMNGRFYMQGGGLTSNAIVSLTLGTPMHFELSRSGGTVNFFINGTIVMTQTGQAASSHGSGTSILTVGCYGGGGGYSAQNAILDDFRITKGVCRHTSNFSVPTSADPLGPVDTSYANVKALLSFEGADTGTSFIDRIGHALTRTGTPTTSATQKKFGSTSGLFASGQAVVAASSSDFALPGDFTVEAWVYPTSWSNSGIIICTNTTGGFQLGMYGAGQLGIGALGQSWVVIGNSIPALNTWSHVAAVRSGAVMTLYINGVSVGSNSNAAGFSYPTAALNISNASNSFVGYIDEVRFTQGVARYTAGFTPPTLSYPTR